MLRCLHSAPNIFIFILAANTFTLKAENKQVIGADLFTIIEKHILILTDANIEYEPEKFATFYEDTTAALPFGQVFQKSKSFKQANTSQLNFGFSGSAYWLKLDLYIKNAPDHNWVLTSENTTLNYIDFYLVNDKNQLIKEGHTGNLRSYDSRELDSRYFLFNLPVKKNNKYTIYLRFQSEDALAFMTKISTFNKYWERHYGLQMIEGFYFGTMVIMAFYNLFLFFAILDFSYLFYVLYIFASILLQLDMGGWFNQYVMRDFPEISSKAGVVFVGIAIFFAIKFMESFINKRFLNKFIKNGFYVIKTVSLVEVMVGFFVPLKYNLPFIFIFLTIVLVPAIFYSIIYALNKGYKSTRYLLLGWSIINLGIIMFSLASFGVIPFNFFSIYGVQIGTSVEVLFLSFALADRINILRVEKQVAQKETIRQLQENSKLLQRLNNEQKRVFQAVLQGEENERKRLAFELHDGIGQLLSVVKLNLSSLEQWMDKKNRQVVELVDSIIILVDDSCREIRNISHNLMPNTVIQFGLVTALEEFCRKINRAEQIKVHFQNLEFDYPLDAQTETSLYRIIQEIVNNSIKHSGAKDIYIQLIKDDDDLIILIEDNGKGFDKKNLETDKGLGIKNIISRIEYVNGKVHLDSSPGKGTTYHISLSRHLISNGG